MNNKKGGDNDQQAGPSLAKRLNKNSSVFAPQDPRKAQPKPQKSPIEEVVKPIIPQSNIIDYKSITNEEEFRNTIHFIKLLVDKESREEAFKQLNNKRDTEPNIASLLWYSVGTIAILLQEIISIYPYLTNLTLTSKASERICNVLGLFQCIALDPKTRILFLKGFVTSKFTFVCISSYKYTKQE